MTTRHKFCGHKSNRLAAIRTLSMRLRGTKIEELQEMGEDVDGLITSTSKLEATMYKLTGVHVTGLNGELRSTFDIMKDLAAVWDDLDTNIRANVLETIAGKNRSSDIAAMLNNWESVENAVMAATNATGTAEQEQAKYMQSIQGHLDVLTSSWQKFSTTLVESDFIKFFVDTGTVILDVLDKLVGTLGTLPTLLAGIGIGAFIKNFDKLKNIAMMNEALAAIGTHATDINVVSRAITGLSAQNAAAVIATTALSEAEQIAMMQSYGLTEAQALEMLAKAGSSAASVTLAGAQTTAATATGGLAKSFKGLTTAIASNPIGAILVAVTALITITVGAVSKFKKHQEELRQQAKDMAADLSESFNGATKEISSNIDTLENMKDEFDKLSKGVDDYGTNISLTSDEYSRYQEIVATVLGMCPELVKGYDNEGTAIANKNGLLEESIRLMQEEQRLKKEEFVSDANLNTMLAGAQVKMQESRDVFEDLNIPNDLAYSGVKIDKKGKRKTGFANHIPDYIESVIGIEKSDWESTSEYIADNIDAIFVNLEEILAVAGADFIDESGTTWAALSDSQVNSLKDYLISIRSYTNEIGDANDDFVTALQVVPESLTQYSSLSSASKGFLHQWIASNFTIDTKTTKTDIKKMKDDIIAFTKRLATDPELQGIIDRGSELNGMGEKISAMTVQEYRDSVDSLISDIEKIDDEDIQVYLKTTIGIGEITTDTDTMVERVQNILVDEFDSEVLNLTLEDLKIAYNISADTDSLTFDELTTKIAETKAAAKMSFEDLMSDEDFTKVIDSYISDIDKLQDAYKKFLSGDLDNTDIVKLIEEFPKLQGWEDDIGDGILNLMNQLTGGDGLTDELGNFIGIYGVFQEQFGNLSTEEDISQLQSFMDMVMSIGTIKTSMDDVYSSTTEKIEDIKTLYKAIADIRSGEMKPEGLMELVGDFEQLNGLDLSKPEEAIAQIETLISSIADTDIAAIFDTAIANAGDDTELVAALTNYKELVISVINDIASTYGDAGGQFKDFMKNEQFTKYVDDSISKVKELYSAIGKIDSGEFTASDFNELLKIFPEELGSYSLDNITELRDGIVSVISDIKGVASDGESTATGIYAFFEKAMQGCDESTCAQLTQYRDLILSIFDILEDESKGEPKTFADYLGDADFSKSTSSLEENIKVLGEMVEKIKNGKLTNADKLTLGTISPDFLSLDFSDIDASVATIEDYVNEQIGGMVITPAYHGSSIGFDVSYTGIYSMFAEMRKNLPDEMKAGFDEYQEFFVANLRDLFNGNPIVLDGIDDFYENSDFTKGIDKFQNNINTLYESMHKIAIGEFNQSDIINLTEMFGDAFILNLDTTDMTAVSNRLSELIISTIGAASAEVNGELQASTGLFAFFDEWIAKATDDGVKQSLESIRDMYIAWAGEVQSGYTEGMSTFAELLSNDEFNTTISNAQDDIRTLYDAIDSITKGEFDTSNLQELIQTFGDRFPELNNIDLSKPEEAIQTLNEAITNIRDVDVAGYFDGLIENLGADTEQGQMLMQFKNIVLSVIDELGNKTISFDKLLKDDSTFKQNVDAVIDKVQTLQDAIDAISKGEFDSVDLKGLVDQFPDLVGKLDLSDAEGSIEILNNYIDTLIGVKSTTEDVDSTGMYALFDGILESCDESSRAQIESYLTLIEQLLGVIRQGGDVKTPFEKLKETTSDLQSTGSLIKSINEEIADSGSNSIDTLIDVMDKYGDKWSEYVTFADDGTFTIDTSKMTTEFNNAIDKLEGVDKSVKDGLKLQFAESISDVKILNDYLSQTESILSTRQQMSGGNMSLLDNVSAAIKLAEDSGKSALSFLGDDFKLNGDAVRAQFDTFVNEMADAANLVEDKREEFIKQANAMYDEAAKAETKGVKSLSDGLSAFDQFYTVQSTLSSGKEFAPIDMLTDLISLAEQSGQSIEDLWDFDSMTAKTDGLDKWLELVVGQLAELKDANQQQLFTADQIENIRKYAEEAHKASEDIATLSETISDAQSILSTRQDMTGGEMTVFDSLSAAAKLAEQTGKQATDFLTSDLTLDSNAMYNAYLDWVISIADASELVGEERSQFLVESEKMWSDATKAEKEGIKSLSEGVSELTNVYSAIDDLNSGDFDATSMFTTAIEIAEKTGQSMSDFFDFDTMEFKLSGFEAGVDVFIAQIGELKTATGEPLIPPERLQELAKWIKLTQEASPFDNLKTGISKVNSATNLIQKAYDEVVEKGTNSMDTLSSVMELFGEDWLNYVSFNADGTTIIDIEAIKTEMYSAIDALEGATPELKQALKNSLTFEAEDSNFSDVVDKYVGDIDKLREAFDKLKSGEGLAPTEIYELVSAFPELASQTDNLGEAIKGMIGNLDSKMLSTFNKALKECKTEEARQQLLGLMQVVSDVRNEAAEPIKITIDTLSEGLENIQTSFEESVSGTGVKAETAMAVLKQYNEMLAEQGKSLVTLNDLYDTSSVGLVEQTKLMEELNKQYVEQQKLKIEKNIDDMVSEYEALVSQLDNTSDAAERAAIAQKAQSLAQQISEASLLAAEYAGLTSKYNQWKQAQSGGEKGDKYDETKSGLESLKELREEGLVGTNEFRAGVGFMTYADENFDASTASVADLVAAYDKAYPKVSKFFKDGTEGCENFLEALQDEGFASKEDGIWKIEDLDVDEVAKKLGVSADLIHVMMGKLSDYGFDINFDNGLLGLDQIKDKAVLAEKTLKDLGKIDDFSFNFNATEDLDKQIGTIQKVIDELPRDEEGNVDISVEGAQEAQYIMAALIMQRQELEKPTIMKLDTADFQGGIAEEIALIQSVIAAAQNLEIQTQIGADTTDAQTQLSNAISALKNSGSNSFDIPLGADDQGIVDYISGLEVPELAVAIGVGEDTLTTFLDGIETKNVNVNVTMTGDDTVDTWLAKDMDKSVTITFNKYDTGVATFVNGLSDLSYTVSYDVKDNGVKSFVSGLSSKTYTITYQYKTTGTKPSAAGVTGTAHANGTAFIHGTSFRSGTWGTKGSGVALVGELGMETLVRDGRFYTIGDTGAEFIKYQKDDIIFNAEQTKELFDKGKVFSGGGRGHAFVDGTAYAGGTYSGSGQFYNTNKTTKSSSASSKNASGTKNTTGKDDKEKIDWIEIAIERVEVAIETLANIADNAYHTLAKRMNATADEIQEVTDEITLQQKAYDRYMKEADSVKLDNKIKELVKSGAIDITEYTKDTVDLINEYEEWLKSSHLIW